MCNLSCAKNVEGHTIANILCFFAAIHSLIYLCGFAALREIFLPLLFALRLPRLITHEKQRNTGHHACEQHDSENEENISQGVVGQHGSKYSSGDVKLPAKREEEQEVCRMLV